MVTMLLVGLDEAWAADLWVGSTATYATIDEALAVAQSGDIVHIGPGTYGPFSLSVPDVSLLGDGGRDLTTITGASAVGASATGARLSGLTFEGGTGGPSVNVTAQVLIEDCRFRSGLTIPASLDIAAVPVEIVRTEFTGNDETPVRSNGSDLVVEDSLFSDNYSTGDSGAIAANGGTLTVTGTDFLRNTALYGAGASYVRDADATFDQCLFEDNQVTFDGGYGGAIRIGNWPDPGDPTALTVVRDSTFRGNRSDKGAISLYQGGTLRVVDSSFELEDRGQGLGLGVNAQLSTALELERVSLTGGRTREWYGTTLFAGSVDQVALTDVTIGGVTDSKSLLAVFDVPSFTGRRLAFVGNAADVGLYVQPSLGDDVSIDALIVCDSPGALVEAGTLATTDADVALDHVTAVGITGPVAMPAGLRITASNAIILGTPTFDDTVVWSTTLTDATADVDRVVRGEPGLGTTGDAACDLALLQPAFDGPAHDAGVGAGDRDGSLSDLGALGGPNGFVLGTGDDADQDGMGSFHDCDDDDASVRPGEEEVPYNDLDEDCDGTALVDVDADGDPAIAAGGEDCDDNDPAVSAGGVDTTHDGVDQDCSGADFVPEIHLATGCATPPNMPLAWAIGLGLLYRCRRRT